MQTLDETTSRDRSQAFQYRAIEQLSSTTAVLPFLQGATSREEAALSAAQSRIAELELKLAEVPSQIQMAAERARSEGEHAARTKAAEECEASLQQSRAAIAAALESFEEDRQSYFRKVEKEAVKLALSIARKVLHREAQLDPLLLSGAVRAALDRLVETSNVILRVPQQDVSGWDSALAEAVGFRRPTIIGESTMKPGECVLESQMGTIEFGAEAQLQEIERGFFDLLFQRGSRELASEGCERCARA